MRSRNLGGSKISASEIGMGCWQFGGDFGPNTKENAEATLMAALDAGITFFDTADVYGGGRSEEILGDFFSSQQKDVVIATKVGRSAALYPHNYAFDDVRDHLLASIERLKVSALDLVQLHCVPPAILKAGEIFQTMDRLKEEGLCKNWGASVETIEEAELCLKQPGCASLQIIFNIFRQDAAWALLPAAQAANVGIIVRLPLASGLLTGKYTSGHVFAEGDHRNYNANGEMFSVGETFSGIEFEKGLELTNELSKFVPEGMTLADMALRWLLDHDAVTTIIAGCSRPDHAQRNAKATTLPRLGDTLHDELRAFYESDVRAHIRCPI